MVRKVPVSVVIPCFNASDTIGRAVSSVINQTVLPYEIILVDDASSDGGVTLRSLREIQRRWGTKMKIQVISLDTNGGASTARNAGWQVATAPYIAFLDADDVWHPRKLDIQYHWMAERPDVVLTGHRLTQVSGEQPIKSEIEVNGDPKKVMPLALLFSNHFPTPTVMLKKDITYRFLAGKRHSEDYLLWLQIVLDGNIAYKLDADLAFSYKAPFGEGGLSANLWAMELGQLHTYYQLYRERKIGLGLTLLLNGYSILKFFRRCLITFQRKLRQRE